MAVVHPDKGWRAGAAVEVFVAATDRKVRPRAVQIDWHSAGAVGQVPDRHGANGMGCFGECGHVVHGSGSVVHMGQHQYGDIRTQRRWQFGFVNQLQCQAVLCAQALRDVQVGREVAALRQQGPAQIFYIILACSARRISASSY